MKILMIEDQRHFADMIVRALEGLNIEVVDSLNAAHDRLAKGRYDLILVDLGLPDSQGVNTLYALSHYKIPKVVLTGRMDISAKMLEYEVQDFVYKIDPVDVYERIMFNVAKIQKTKKPRFTPHVFEQLRACFEQDRAEVLELTTA